MNNVDGFWRDTERTIRECLGVVLIYGDDADVIVGDLMRRLRGIPVTLPLSVRPDFFVCFGAAVAALIAAEHRLIVVKTGQTLSRAISALPPMPPLIYNHPFLGALQNVVAQIDAEAEANKYGRRTS